MQKKRKRTWLMIAVIILSLLLLYWLFVGSILEEDQELGAAPIYNTQEY